MGQIPVYTGTTSAQFYVDKLSPVKGFIEEFVDKNLTEFEYDKQKHTYNFICNYVVWDDKTNNLIIPINFLPLLEDYLETRGYPKVFKRVPLEPIKARQSTIRPNPDWTPREHQIPIIDYILHDSRSRKGISLATGQGKMLKNGTPVRTPDGWKPIEQLKVGDMVIAPDGKAYPVTGVYHHKKKTMYRVSFRDERYLDVGADHLWETVRPTTKNGVRCLKTEVMDTFDMVHYVKTPSGESKIYIPLIKPEERPEVELPIDPYMLGSLIANGCFNSDSITLTTPDEYVVNYFKTHLRKGYSLNYAGGCNWRIARDKGNLEPHYYLNAIEKLGLRYHKAETKFIPEIYLKGSLHQRWELLRGLMDGDGGDGEKGKIHVKADGTVKESAPTLRYSTVSVTLSKQIQQLIWSFGDMCNIRPRLTKYTDHDGNRIPGNFEDQRINIRAKVPSMYHNCPTKKSRTNDNGRNCKFLRLRVEDIQAIGNSDATCIAIDSPNNTYVAKDYITTHNTFIANNSAAQLGLVTMVIMGSNIPQWVKNISEQTTVHENFTYIDSKEYTNIYKWVKDCNSQAKEKGSKIWILMGSDSFYQLVNDKVYPDIFVCSISTLREFIENGEAYQNLPWNWQGFLKEYGIGTKIVDEAHQNFHAVNKLDLLSNIKNNVYLTATFEKTGISASRIFNTVYPTEMRYGDSNVAQYTNCTVYAYRGMVPAHFVKRKRGYNAIKYEQYLLKRPMWMKDYLNNVVLPEVYMHYVKKRNPGEKCLLFFSTKAMIEKVRDFLNFELAKYGIVAKEKIGGTPDDVLNDPQFHIYIGTPGGMGTGRDIPHLRTAINFVSFDSPVLTKQCYGRLRRIPGVDTEWVDNVDRMIDSQVRHWQKRDRFYRKAAKTYHKIKLS